MTGQEMKRKSKEKKTHLARECVLRPLGHMRIPYKHCALRPRSHDVVVTGIRGQQQLFVLGGPDDGGDRAEGEREEQENMYEVEAGRDKRARKYTQTHAHTHAVLS